MHAFGWEALFRIAKVVSRMVRVVDPEARTVAYILDDAAGFIRMVIGKIGEFEA